MYLSSLFRSSIGKKIIVSLTGLFLVIFLLVHLTLNLFTLVSEDLFNDAAHFMATNPLMKILEIVLALGFIFHIVFTSYLTLKNQYSRPVKYAVVDQCNSSSWSSRNMYITGGMVFIFLVIHLINYYYKIKFTSMITNHEITEFKLVTGIFDISHWYFVLLYLAAFLLLGLHLNHSFQSGFQTLGLNNSKWLPRLKVLGSAYAILIIVGFSIIPLYFFILNLIK